MFTQTFYLSPPNKGRSTQTRDIIRNTMIRKMAITNEEIKKGGRWKRKNSKQKDKRLICFIYKCNIQENYRLYNSNTRQREMSSKAKVQILNKHQEKVINF